LRYIFSALNVARPVLHESKDFGLGIKKYVATVAYFFAGSLNTIQVPSIRQIPASQLSISWKSPWDLADLFFSVFFPDPAKNSLFPPGYDADTGQST
jgi:hypothetical protein